MRISNLSLARRRDRPPVVDLAPPPEPTSACWAPDSTLYFAPDGSVRACCVNTEYPLGQIGKQSIGEIWRGARTAALRSALAGGDFSLGCQECGSYEQAGNRDWGNAPQFDEYAGREVPDHPRRMDFILSNTCNLMCQMCHGGLSSAIRAQREKLPPLPKAYGDDFFEELREYLPHLEKTVFLGGEPFLARESRRVWDLMIEMGLQIPTTVVTNGTQWNEKVERYLHEIPMDITVSIDGATAHTVETIRLGTQHDELMANVDRYQEIVEARGGTLSLHFCLMAQNWHELGDYLIDADRAGRHASIMTVTYPPRFSFYHLPASELREALRTWEAADAHVSSQLERNLAVWEAELDRLRRHLTSLEEGGQPVWLRATSEAPPRDPAADEAFATARAELAEWSRTEPLSLEVVDGVVTQVDAPAWAERLDAARWVGLSPEQLVDAIAVHLGPSQPADQDELVLGVSRSITRFGPDGSEQVELRALVRSGVHGAPEQIVIFAPEAALASAP